MATTNNLRKGLNRKIWELCNTVPAATAAGAFTCPANDRKQLVMYFNTGSNGYLYSPEEDGYVTLPVPSLSGTFTNGVCCAANNFGLSGTATAGTATTLTTNQTILRDLRGYKIHITGGAGAGDVVEILSNTIGANSVITANFSTTITTASTYRIMTPRWYFINAGTVASGSFKMYCYALNTWTTLSVTGFTGSLVGDAKFISTPSFVRNEFQSFATGTATAGTVNTLSNTAKAWTTNQWANYQIRITAGTGLGQVRTISSNTGTVITVSSNWTTNPDATSQYSIEGNDDFLYFIGNNSTTTYRYNITANTWTTLTARPSSSGAGLSANWVNNTDDSTWLSENAIINGRRIYTFRGNGTVNLDYYDIPSNTWVGDISYSPKTDTISSGTKFVYYKNFIYLQLNVTNRWLRYNILTSDMEGWHVINITQGAAVVGETSFVYLYTDGATTIPFIYFILNTTTLMVRSIII